jgi:four helix bundle protein
VSEIHEMTLSKLPKFEMYEVGNQIRRSCKSTKSNIVEGYGRRYYKQEFIHHLIIALAPNDETIDHLETLYETKSLIDENEFSQIHSKLEMLGKKLNSFIQSVEKEHLSSR